RLGGGHWAVMATSTRRTTAADDAPPTWRWVFGAAVVAFGVLAAALVFGGGTTTGVIPGLTDPGELTRWGLPVATVVLNVPSATTVGLVLLAGLLPAPTGVTGRDARRSLRCAALTALVWAVAAAVLHVLTPSDLLGVSLNEALE